MKSMKFPSHDQAGVILLFFHNYKLLKIKSINSLARRCAGIAMDRHSNDSLVILQILAMLNFILFIVHGWLFFSLQEAVYPAYGIVKLHLASEQSVLCALD